MLDGSNRWDNNVKMSCTTRKDLTGTRAIIFLITATILIGFAVPAVMADNTTATATQTTATTTVPTTTQTTVQTTATTTQTTSATTTATTVATTVPTTTQTTAVYYSQSYQTPDFTATPLSGTAPLTVEFTDTSTGTPTSWWWYFGDGATDSAQNPTHTYTDTGTFTVTLNVVIDGITYTAIEDEYISVTETETTTTTTTATTATTAATTTTTVAPVDAAFIASPVNGAAPLTVQFTDGSTGSPTSWDWDFGDDGTSTLKNPTHTYSSPGKYSVTLSVTGSGGSDEVTRTSYIIVTSPTPVPTTRVTAPVTSAMTMASSLNDAASPATAEGETSSGQNNLTIPWFYILVIVVIVIIAGIGIIIWRRRNWYDELG